MELIFLRPDGPDNNRARETLMHAIRHSEGLVRAAVAYFTDKEIVDAVLERKQERRPTRLLLNTLDIIRPVSPTVTELVLPRPLATLLRSSDGLRLEVRGLGRPRPYRNMHHKFLTADDVVIFGSVNWTPSALGANYECLAISKAPALIEQFTAEFDFLWDGAGDLAAGHEGIRRIYCPQCGLGDSVDLESYGPYCMNCQHRFKVVEQ